MILKLSIIFQQKPIHIARTMFQLNTPDYVLDCTEMLSARAGEIAQSPEIHKFIDGETFTFTAYSVIHDNYSWQ